MHYIIYIYWLVVLAILKNMKVSWKDDTPYIMETKKCLKPPTSIYIMLRKTKVYQKAFEGFWAHWLPDQHPAAKLWATYCQMAADYVADCWNRVPVCVSKYIL